MKRKEIRRTAGQLEAMGLTHAKSRLGKCIDYYFKGEPNGKETEIWHKEKDERYVRFYPSKLYVGDRE